MRLALGLVLGSVFVCGEAAASPPAGVESAAYADAGDYGDADADDSAIIGDCAPPWSEVSTRPGVLLHFGSPVTAEPALRFDAQATWVGRIGCGFAPQARVGYAREGGPGSGHYATAGGALG